jgi:hypothetical protein
MPVLSLTREDAERLGYDNAKAWRNLIRSKQINIAKAYNIPLDELKWYGAFHNEAHHPHIHLIIFSKSGGGFITKDRFEKLRSEFTREIYKDELYQLYNDKTLIREKLTQASEEKLNKIFNNMCDKTVPDEFVNLMNMLTTQLKNHEGKKTYGYLDKETKQTVNEIFKFLSKDVNIADYYNEWCNIQAHIMGYYQNDEIDFQPLYENEVFRKIKNKIINSAVKAEEQTIKPENVFNELIYMIAKMIDSSCHDEINHEHKRSVVDSKTMKEIYKKKHAMGMKIGGM